MGDFRLDRAARLPRRSSDGAAKQRVRQARVSLGVEDEGMPAVAQGKRWVARVTIGSVLLAVVGLRDRAGGGLAWPVPRLVDAGPHAPTIGATGSRRLGTLARFSRRVRAIPPRCGSWPGRRPSLAATTRRCRSTPNASTTRRTRPRTTCSWGWS